MAVKDVEIWTNDDKTNLTLEEFYQSQKTSEIQYFNFAAKLSLRYFKIVAKTC